MSIRVIRLARLHDKLGIGETMLKGIRQNDPTFPKPIVLGPRAIGFYEHEIDEWIAARAKLRYERDRPGVFQRRFGPNVYTDD